MWRRFWQNVLVFLLGGLFCYITLQWRLLVINMEVHVPEFLATVGAAISGVYIASTLQKRTNQSQNRYAFLSAKLDALWSEYNVFYDSFNGGNVLAISSVVSLHSSFLKKISFLKKQFQVYGMKVGLLEEIEMKIDIVESLLTNSDSISNNQIDLTQAVEKQQVLMLLDEVHETFGAVFGQIHNS